jgi:hexokinase
MANTFKSVTSGSIGTTLTDVYTCPASTTTIILGASIANIHSNPIGGSIKLAKNGGDDVDKLQFQSDVSSSLDSILSLLEIS